MNNLNYTDQHDVDEDMMTICTCYGAYNHGDDVGIMHRYVNDSPTLVSGDVASRQKIIYLLPRRKEV